MLRKRARLARNLLLVVLSVIAVASLAANRQGTAEAEALPKVSVTINADGHSLSVRSVGVTVGEVLTESGVELGPLDAAQPSLTQRPYEGMSITVVRLREEIVEKTVPISYGTVKRFSRSIRSRMVKELRPGLPGVKLIRSLVRYQDGVAIKQEVLSSRVVKKPQDRIVELGAIGSSASRGFFRTRRVVRMVATAYDPGPRSCGPRATGRTSCGMRAGYGVVAVDPRVIRLGSKVYVSGYGFAVAGDRGRAIKGRRIDLGFDTYSQARRYGRKVVLVEVLE